MSEPEARASASLISDPHRLQRVGQTVDQILGDEARPAEAEGALAVQPRGGRGGGQRRQALGHEAA